MPCKLCGKPAHIEFKGRRYCSKCWHEYPEGFQTVGWEFVFEEQKEKSRIEDWF